MTDVLIVGYGPVGQLMAILLGQRGFDVTAVEKWPSPYPMPRAVSFDGEAQRILAAAGLTEAAVAPVIEPSRNYTWRNAFGRTLLHLDVADRGRTGFADSVSFYQPGLEAVLAARGAELPNVTVLRGVEAVGLTEHGDSVDVTLAGEGGPRRVSVSWVIGCDGANSFVRRHIGATVTDLGFTHDWLICDVVPNEPREFEPNNLQVCDPARPRTAVSAGPGHRRWEFMRVPGETMAEFDSVESVWRLLKLFDITEQNAVLERYNVYTTQACYAEQWRSGRIFLAGDAAHVMPPFLGQGMTSGFRDAINLTWKLDLVDRGLADDGLLDTYAVERRAHVQYAIAKSIVSGEVICETDPKAAAGRDAAMLAAIRRGGSAKDYPRALLERLADGVVHRVGADPAPVAGEPAPQGAVTVGGRTGRLDDLVGTGFALIARDDPRAALDPNQLSFLERIGARPVRLCPPDAAPAIPAADSTGADGGLVEAVDVDGVYGSYLDGAGVVAVLVRPDFYVFGVAADAGGVTALVDDLRQQITSRALTP
jgi:flavoprotein hydroxylase